MLASNLYSKGDSGMNMFQNNLNNYVLPSEILWSAKTNDDDKRIKKFEESLNKKII